jgi:hypothetical protein
MKLLNRISILLLILSLTNCTSTKSVLIKKGVDLTLQPSNLSLTIKGKGLIDVYSKKIEVTINEGTMRINPKFNNNNWKIIGFELGLSKVIDPYKGSWKMLNSSGVKKIYHTIESKEDSFDFSNYKFTIPYSNSKDLKNAWITLRVIRDSGGRVFSHSKGRKQNF